MFQTYVYVHVLYLYLHVCVYIDTYLFMCTCMDMCMHLHLTCLRCFHQSLGETPPSSVILLCREWQLPPAAAQAF